MMTTHEIPLLLPPTSSHDGISIGFGSPTSTHSLFPYGKGLRYGLVGRNQRRAPLRILREA